MVSEIMSYLLSSNIIKNEDNIHWWSDNDFIVQNLEEVKEFIHNSVISGYTSGDDFGYLDYYDKKEVISSLMSDIEQYTNYGKI